MATKIDYYKKRLEEEKAQLEEELSSVARRKTENPSDWEPSFPEMNTVSSDEAEMANALEEFEVQVGIAASLADKLNQVKAALERIEKGAFGMCEVDGKPIEEERLGANPTATTCIPHSSKHAG